MTKLLFGCGYLGSRVAPRWLAAGEDVVVVTRSRGRAAQFRKQGFEAIIADVTKPKTLISLPAVETILFAVGFDRTGSDDCGPSIDKVYAGGMQNVLAALPAETGRLIYISTTGVYGPGDGDWVDEQTPPDPQRDGGRASLAAEQAIQDHPLGRRSIILRLAGIYGSQRIPYLEKLRRGEPLSVPSEGYLNLIHVDDAATVILAADRWGQESLGKGPRVYCVSDGSPVIRGEYYREVARQIGAQEPQFMASDPSAPRTARAAVSRQICNARMLQDFSVQLAYPSYREGLAAILGKSGQG